MKRNVVLFVLLCFCALPLFAGGSGETGPEAAFPSRPIQMIVPYATGGTTDTISRMMAVKLSEVLKQQVNIINRPGAGGEVGTLEVANAKPDGYTIGGVQPGDLLLIHSTRDTFKLEMLDYVGRFASNTYGLVVKPGSQIADLDTLIQFGKANPGTITAAESGAATKLFELMFADQAGIEITVISFNSGGDATNAVLGGHVDMAGVTEPWYKPLVVDGKCTLVGIGGSVPWTNLESAVYLPTKGFKGLECSSVAPAIALPNGVDESVRKVYLDAIQKMGVDSSFKATITGGGYGWDFKVGDDLKKAIFSDAEYAAPFIQKYIDFFK